MANLAYTFYVAFVVFALLSGTAACFRSSAAHRIGLFAIGPLLLSYFGMIASRKIFSDSLGYQDFFFSIKSLGDSSFNAGFELYTLIYSQIGSWPIYLLSFPILLLSSALIQYRSIRRATNYSVAIFVLLVWPFFWAYSATGFRQSLAISFGLLAVAALSRARLVSAAALMFIATSFHTSALILVLSTLTYWRRTSPKALLIAWFSSILAAAVFPTDALFSQLTVRFDMLSQYAFYFNDNIGLDYNSGLRADFVLFSAIPIVAFHLRRPSYLTNELFLQITYKSYLILNAFANLISDIPYSDRVYGYSWVLAPVLVASIWEEIPQAGRAILAASLVLLAATYSPHWVGL